jgi:hypothetical protein
MYVIACKRGCHSLQRMHVSLLTVIEVFMPAERQKFCGNLLHTVSTRRTYALQADAKTHLDVWYTAMGMYQLTN